MIPTCLHLSHPTIEEEGKRLSADEPTDPCGNAHALISNGSGQPPTRPRLQVDNHAALNRKWHMTWNKEYFAPVVGFLRLLTTVSFVLEIVLLSIIYGSPGTFCSTALIFHISICLLIITIMIGWQVLNHSPPGFRPSPTYQFPLIWTMFDTCVFTGLFFLMISWAFFRPSVFRDRCHLGLVMTSLAFSLLNVLVVSFTLHTLRYFSIQYAAGDPRRAVLYAVL